MSLNLNDVVTDGSAKFQVVKNATTSDITNAVNNFANELGYRQKNKTYAVGDITYHSDLPVGWYLECTIAGTTSNNELSISLADTQVNDTINDGTIIWIVRNESQFFKEGLGPVTDDYNNYTKPGVYSIRSNNIENKPSNISSYGILIVHSVGYGKESFYGDSYIYQKAILILNVGEEYFNRSFIRTSFNNKTEWTNWSEENYAIDYVFNSSGGYISYNNGMKIQWGTVGNPNNITAMIINYPISFNVMGFPICIGRYGAESYTSQNYNINTFNISTQSFYLAAQTAPSYVDWIAIGS